MQDDTESPEDETTFTDTFDKASTCSVNVESKNLLKVSLCVN